MKHSKKILLLIIWAINKKRVMKSTCWVFGWGILKALFVVLYCEPIFQKITDFTGSVGENLWKVVFVSEDLAMFVLWRFFRVNDSVLGYFSLEI